MKKRAVWLNVFLVFVMLLSLTASAFNSAAGQSAADGGYSEIPFRITELSRVLGIPQSDLVKMDSQELLNLYSDNADKLGVTVYQSVYNESTEEYELKIIAQAQNKHRTSADDVDTAVKAGYALYMPVVASSNGFITYESTIDTAITQAKAYLDSMFADSYPNGYVLMGLMKNYPSMPLSIRSQADPNGIFGKLFLGDYRRPLLTKKALGLITGAVVGGNYTLLNISFETGTDFNYNQPDVWADTVDIPSNGSTNYQVTNKMWDTSDPTPWDLYLGDDLLWSNLSSVPVNEVVSVQKPFRQGYASSRFNIEGVIPPAIALYESYTDPWKVSQLQRALDHYGVNYADPMSVFYGQEADQPYDFMWESTSYPQCYFYNDGVESTVSRAYAPYRYLYESEKCGLDNIANRKHSNFDVVVQAIHVLSHYNDPFFDYFDPRSLLPASTTPYDIGQWINAKYNGYGIPVEGADTQYAEAGRTNAYALLTTLLAYKYNLSNFKYAADSAIEVLTKVQFGVWHSAVTGSAETRDWGTLYRPGNTGGQLLMWYKDGEDYVLPSAEVMKVLDQDGMPPEIMDLSVDTTTTLQYIAVLSAYDCLKFGHCR